MHSSIKLSPKELDTKHELSEDCGEKRGSKTSPAKRNFEIDLPATVQKVCKRRPKKVQSFVIFYTKKEENYDVSLRPGNRIKSTKKLIYNSS